MPINTKNGEIDFTEGNEYNDRMGEVFYKDEGHRRNEL
jgi:hypothetical protein